MLSVQWLTLVTLLLLVAGAVAQLSTNASEAEKWYEQFDRELGQQRTVLYEANWAYNLDINKENSDRLAEKQLVYAKFVKDKSEEIRAKFNYTGLGNETLTRLFAKAVDIGTSVANETMQRRFSRLQSTMKSIYSSAKVKEQGSDKELPLDPDITRLLGDPEVSEPRKRHLWVAWRDESGKKMGSYYAQFVATINAMIKEAGHENMAKYWQGYYEPKPGQDFEKMMEQMWNKTLPMYRQLHAYVRHKLKQKYGEEIFPPTGQIPAHILGNMWSQSWNNIETFATPYPNVSRIDITEEMKKQNWNITHMVRVSEKFFTSIGLKPMTDTFWKKSVFDRLPGVEMVCHASAWDFYTGNGDFRIKQCTTITMSYLGTTHHEMGHIQYYQQYERQKVLDRRGANPGFHEAIGDVMELSVMTPDHLKEIGLLKETEDSKEYYINYLFQMALGKVAFLPFGYLIDRWRWRAFDGTLTPEEYNDFWWKLRCDLQGVSSPVRRSKDDFDPGAKYHVSSNTPYIRYFISHILQFQFYEALCNASGHTGPLYRCDFYQNEKAGGVMGKMMRHGSSLHWEDVLYEMTGTREMRVEPLLNYFEDLTEFLEEENRKNGVQVGWQSQCPPDEWYDRTTTAQPPPTTTTKAAVATSASFGVALAAAASLLLSLTA